MRDAALAQAIEIIGGVSAVAKLFGVTPGAVSQWDRAPALYVYKLAEATGGRVPTEVLRPDMFPTGTAPPADRATRARRKVKT